MTDSIELSQPKITFHATIRLLPQTIFTWEVRLIQCQDDIATFLQPMTIFATSVIELLHGLVITWRNANFHGKVYFQAITYY